MLISSKVVKIHNSGAQRFNRDVERKFKKWLLPFRLLSRGFYDIITPIVYYNVELERRFLLTGLAWKEEPLVAERIEVCGSNFSLS
jgi:hypothetical protein